MPNHRLRNFLGRRPVEFNGVGIYSPTIDQIDEVGEIGYNIYIAYCTFNKEVVLKHLFGFSEEDYVALENEDAYVIFTSVAVIIEELINALSFFVKDEVWYDSSDNSFGVGDKVFLTSENYSEFVNVISQQNGMMQEEESGLKFKNKKTQQMYEEMQKMKQEVQKKKSEKEESLSLKDMLSILCNAEGNGIHVFNVGELTIYQVYEHFERLNIKEQHVRLLQVWSNDRRLDEKDELPEWITKGKL